MCAGPEDGHPAAWRRRVRGEESESDPQVSAEHLGRDRSAGLWHAGEREENHRVWPTVLHLFLLAGLWLHVVISQVTLELLCFVSFTEGCEDFEYH